MFKRFFRFIKEDVFGIKDIFRIKIEKTWWSERYVYIKFSKNNGWTWEYIIRMCNDIDSNCGEYEIERKTFNIESLDWVISHEFNTYESCVKHNIDTYKFVKEHNNRVRREYEKKIKKENDTIKRINDRYKK
jgi:hypothetical protein